MTVSVVLVESFDVPSVSIHEVRRQHSQGSFLLEVISTHPTPPRGCAARWRTTRQWEGRPSSGKSPRTGEDLSFLEENVISELARLIGELDFTELGEEFISKNSGRSAKSADTEIIYDIPLPYPAA